MRQLARLPLFFLPLFCFAQEPLFTVAGSNTVGAELAPQCATAYMADKLNASHVVRIAGATDNEFVIAADNNRHIAFRAHGSSTGFRSLLNGSADIAMASRSIKPAEHKQLAGSGDLTSASAENAIAIDGLAVIVNKVNPIKQLTIQQLSQIFSGNITNWASLGGANTPINIYARDKNSGTWDTFKSLVLKQNPLAREAQRFESNAVLSAYVASDVNGIGFTSLASIGSNQALAIADTNTAFLLPSLLNVASEDYLLSRRLYMYVPPLSDNPYAADFVEYCQSKAGQDIALQAGFVSQNVVASRPEVPQSAPAAYRELSAVAQRLSLNFRFVGNTAELDNKAKRDAKRLLAFYRDNAKELDIVLVGFSDSKSRPSTANILSKLRALAVKNVLQDEGINVAQWLALGAQMPVTAKGLSTSVTKNGRVEVWVKAKRPSFASID